MLDINKLTKVTEPDYPKKIDHPQNTKMWSKWWFFDFISKTDLTILIKCRTNQFMHFSCIFWVGFWYFLANHLKYFDETWSEVKQNGYKTDAKDQGPSD